MITERRSKFSILVLSVLQISTAAFPDGMTEEKFVPAESALEVIGSIDSKTVSISDGFDIDVSVRFREGAKEENYIIQRIALFLPAEYRRLRPDLIDNEVPVNLVHGGETVTATGSSSGFAFNFEASGEEDEGPRRLGHRTSWLAKISVNPAPLGAPTISRLTSRHSLSKLEIWVYVTNEVSGNVTGEQLLKSNVIELNTRPPEFSVYFGAVLGSMLVVLAFWIFSRSSMIDGSLISRFQSPTSYLFSMLLSSISVALIVLLLSTRLDDVGLPVNIQVNDFLGGIVVGLLSVQLSSIVAKRIFPTPAPTKEV